MENLKTKAQFFKVLADVTTLHPQYSLAQHFTHIMRHSEKEGGTKKLYHFTDQEMLKKVEKYYDELNNEVDGDT